jgi:nicotinate-nucleotide adenylyltransferase
MERLEVRKIGIFGGTFDPPHLGHLILAAEAKSQLGLDHILWVLTPDPPHKSGRRISGVDVRIQLVEAAIEGDADFSLSMVDIEREPPLYAVDTVQILKKRHPGAQLIYLMGADSLHDLPEWHEAVEFVARCDGLGVMCRPGEEIDLSELEDKIPGIFSKVAFIDAPLLEIASSEIRERIRSGGHYRFYLPERVFRVVERQHLYR